MANNINQEHDGIMNEVRQLNIARNDGKFQRIPDTTEEKYILYITGQSG